MIPSPDDVPVWAVRLEAKLDVALARQAGEITTLNKDVDGVKTQVQGLDGRVDVLERSNFITPKGLTATILGSITGVAGFVALIERLST